MHDLTQPPSDRRPFGVAESFPVARGGRRDMDRPTGEDACPGNEDVSRRGRRRLTTGLGLVWPLLCVLMTISTLELIEHVSKTAYLQAKDAIWWADGVLAVAGSAAAGLVAARDHERVRSVAAFAAWAAVVSFWASGVYIAVNGIRR